MLPPSFCHARLPNAGLGNKLFVWAKAFVFASLNQLPLVVTGWTQLQKAPLLHGGDLRLYWNYFKRTAEVDWVTRFRARRRSRVVAEPAVARLEGEPVGVVYEFSQVPHWADPFGEIRPYRNEVREALLRMLTPARERELGVAKPPIVCANVRMGDFRPLDPNTNFKETGNTRTPLDYFRNLIEDIRQAHGSPLPVEIVTDGSARELAQLLDLPRVSLAPRRSKIVDILMMSRSQILLASAGSTFSYWAGFLGECALILHPDHVHEAIRPAEVNRAHYEGPLVGPPAEWPALFLDGLPRIPDATAGGKQG
jgi:hypothetical protein